MDSAKIVRPLEAAQKDKRYKPSTRKRLTASSRYNMYGSTNYSEEKVNMLMNV